MKQGIVVFITRTKIRIPARRTQNSIRSLLFTEPIRSTWIASSDRDAVLMIKRPNGIGPVSLIVHGISFSADAPLTDCPVVRLAQLSSTLSLYRTKLVALMFHLLARSLHVLAVAVSLRVQLGVNCLVHIESPAESGLVPVGTKKEDSLSFLFMKSTRGNVQFTPGLKDCIVD